MKRYNLICDCSAMDRPIMEAIDGDYIEFYDISCANCKKNGDCVIQTYGVEACSKCEVVT